MGEGAFPIRPQVCIAKGCYLCPVHVYEIPDSCPYGILHGLASESFSLREVPRRSGKTTAINRLAEQFANAGENVYIIVRTTALFDICFRRVKGMNNVRLFSIYQVKNSKMMGLLRGKLLMDDVCPEDIEQNPMHHAFAIAFALNDFVGGFYSTWE